MMTVTMKHKPQRS